MDTDVTHRSPETATVGSLCEVLLSSVQTTAMDVTAFVRRCRSARADLAPTTRELSELHMVLALLGGDHESQGGGGGPAGARKKGGTRIPKELQAHLRPVLTTCIAAVLRIDGILRQHGNDEGEDTPKWTAQARDEVRDLGRVLGTCRGVLGLVSDLVSILASSGSQGVTPDGLRLPDILGQLHNLLRSSSSSALTTSQSQSSNATLAGQQHQTLQAHLGHIIAYAETLAKSKDWEKAARALDEAQEKTAAAAEKEEVRGSIPVTAPLRKIPGSTSKATTTTQDAGGMGDNFIVLNRGFENFLVREDGGGRRCSASLLFAPTHRGPEPGSLMAGGPSTGMMIMDGAGLPGMSGTNHSLQPVVQGSTTTANPRQHLGRRTSSVIYTTEKEVAMPMPRDEVTEEALAFAQVPVHVLGRLSLNLVGHVYTGNNNHSPGQGNVSGGSSSADQTSYYNHSLLTVRTDEGCFDDGASARTSDAGSLHDGDLQFSQLDLSKPAPPPGAVSMSMSISQPLPLASPPSSQTTTTLVSRTPLFASQITIPASSSSQQPLPPPLALPPTQPLLPLPLPLPPSSSSQQQALPAMLTSTPAATSQPRPRPRPPPQPLQNSGSSSSNNPPEPGQQAPPPHHQQHHDERAAPTNVQSRSASAPLVYYGPPPPPPAPSEGHRHGLREMRSTSTMNTHAFMTAAMMNTQKPLPRTPLVYIPTYPGPFVKTKAVVVGNFSCGKTCLITRMSRGHYPRTKQERCGITETVRVSVDDDAIELSLWDIRGIDYDPTWLKGAHVALICFSVNIGSTDSKGKHLGRWVAEVNRNCPGAAILLVGTKADIRAHARSVAKISSRGQGLVTPAQGAMFRDNIGASRYLECSARTGEGVVEVLGETARVAVQVKRAHQLRKNGGGSVGGAATRPLSRIGRFLGWGNGARVGT